MVLEIWGVFLAVTVTVGGSSGVQWPEARNVERTPTEKYYFIDINVKKEKYIPRKSRKPSVQFRAGRSLT